MMESRRRHATALASAIGVVVMAVAIGLGPGAAAQTDPTLPTSTSTPASTSTAPTTATTVAPSTTASTSTTIRPTTTTTRPRPTTTTTRPRASTTTTEAPPTTTAAPATTASTVAPAEVPGLPTTTTTQAPGSTATDGGLSSTDKLRMVIGGLVFVALAIAVLTVLYVRHTKPSRAVTPVIDDDGAGTDEVVRTTADEAGVVAASSAVTVIGAKKVVGHDHDNTVSTIAAAEPSHDAGQSGADMAPDDVVARDDIPAEVELPTRVDLDVPAAVVTREDLEVLARPSSPLTKADLFAGVPSNTGELPVPRAFDASELFVDDGAAPPSSSA